MELESKRTAVAGTHAIKVSPSGIPGPRFNTSTRTPLCLQLSTCIQTNLTCCAPKPLVSFFKSRAAACVARRVEQVLSRQAKVKFRARVAARLAEEKAAADEALARANALAVAEARAAKAAGHSLEQHRLKQRQEKAKMEKLRMQAKLRVSD